MTIKKVLERMWNWKSAQAYEEATKINDFPAEALEILKELSGEFGNCGWCDGNVFNKLREKNNKVADLLGYEYKEDEDFWVKKKKKYVNLHIKASDWKEMKVKLAEIIKQEGSSTIVTDGKTKVFWSDN